MQGKLKIRMKKKFFDKVDINNYLDRNNGLLVFLLLFIGTLIPSISGYLGTNMWEKLLYIISNPVFNTMLFISIGFIILKSSIKLSQNYFYVCRYPHYKIMIKNNIKTIIVLIIFISIISIILALAGAVVFSLGNISLEQHSKYNISIIIYILFRLFRGMVFNCFIGIDFYCLYLLFQKNVYRLFVILSSFLCFLLPNLQEVKHFYNLPFIYHYYFMNVEYSSFFLEIICSLLYGLILIFLTKLIYKLASKNKKDLI